MDLTRSMYQPLDDAGVDQLRAAIATYLAAVMRTAIMKASAPDVLSRLAEHEPAIVDYFELLHHWSTGERAHFDHHVQHWSAPFLLSRVTSSRSARECRAAIRTLVTLAALDGADRGESGLPLCASESGELFDSRASSRLPLDQPTFDHLVHDRSAARSHDWIRPPRTFSFGIPVIVAGVEFGVVAESGSGDHGRDRRSSDVRVLRDGLDAAFALLESCWPETLRWIGEMVPAFVSLGPPPDLATLRSESYGPGTPVFTSMIGDPVLLAEAIVHEVQHHRFRLWAASKPLPGIERAEPAFCSPYREDLRPLLGVHLGLHAFAAVNELRLRLDAGARTKPLVKRLARSHYANLYALRTILEHEQPAPSGLAYLVDIAGVIVDQHERISRIDSGLQAARAADSFRQRCRRLEASAPGSAFPVNSTPEYWDWKSTLGKAADMSRDPA